MHKPENPYFRLLNNGKISILWSVFEGDWEDLTVDQIAEVLNTTTETVRNYIRRIKKDTGYDVPHVDGRIARYMDE